MEKAMKLFFKQVLGMRGIQAKFEGKNMNFYHGGHEINIDFEPIANGQIDIEHAYGAILLVLDEFGEKKDMVKGEKEMMKTKRVKLKKDDFFALFSSILLVNDMRVRAVGDTIFAAHDNGEITVNIDQMFRDYESEKVELDSLVEHTLLTIEFEKFPREDQEKVDENLIVGIFNADDKKIEVENSIHMEVGDFVVAPIIGLNRGYTLFQIKDGLVPQRVVFDALVNTAEKYPASLERIESMSFEAYTLSAGDYSFGAVALFYPGLIDDIYKKHGEYYVLPASGKSMIIVPKKNCPLPEKTFEEFLEKLSEIGEKPISKKILSYDGKSLK